MSSASPCSFTITAPPPAARAAAAPARTSTMPAGLQMRSAFRTTCSTTRAALPRPSSTALPRATPPARRRSRASPATSRSSSATFSTPPRSSAPTCWRRAITFSAARARTVQSWRAPSMPIATRAISCSPPRPSSFATCGSRSAACRRRKCASWRASSHLPVAEKADSQDICFVPTGRYTGVIERLKPGALKPGDIVHVDGRHLGRHEGIVNYTIGQRKGLKIAGPEPLYVVRLDAARNEVVVGPRDCLRTHGLAP